MKDRTRKYWRDCWPHVPVIIALFYLLIAWTLFLVVDANNLWGLRDWLAQRQSIPVTWYYLFEEGGATEIAQWLMLSCACVAACSLAGRLWGDGKNAAALFWLLMGITAALMLIEDAGNPRHYLAALSVTLFPDRSPQRLKTTVELLYYVGLSLLPVYAVLRYWRYPLRSRLTALYLLTGCALYGVAGFASASRHINEWYAAFGGMVHRVLAGGQLLVPPSWDQYMLHFFLVDWLLEESVELIGASLLTAAALAYLRDYGKRPGMADQLQRRTS